MASQLKLSAKIEFQLNILYVLSNLRKRRRFLSNFYKRYYLILFSYIISIKTVNYMEISTFLRQDFGAFFYYVKSNLDSTRTADILKKNI
jgi:hypothetical protein